MSALKQPAGVAHFLEPINRLIAGLIERAEDNNVTIIEQQDLIHELRCTIDDLANQLHDKEKTCPSHT